MERRGVGREALVLLRSLRRREPRQSRHDHDGAHEAQERTDAGDESEPAKRVELADRERVPMVTFDEKVLKTYPTIAKRPRDLL